MQTCKQCCLLQAVAHCVSVASPAPPQSSAPSLRRDAAAFDGLFWVRSFINASVAVQFKDSSFGRATIN